MKINLRKIKENIWDILCGIPPRGYLYIIFSLLVAKKSVNFSIAMLIFMVGFFAVAFLIEWLLGEKFIDKHFGIFLYSSMFGGMAIAWFFGFFLWKYHYSWFGFEHEEWDLKHFITIWELLGI